MIFEKSIRVKFSLLIILLIVLSSSFFISNKSQNKDYFKDYNHHHLDRDLRGKAMESSISTNSYEWFQIWGGEDRERSETDYERNLDYLALDSSENVYVVGTTNSYGTGFWDISLLKYSPKGILLWNKTWGGTDIEKPKELVIDSSDNIYIAGETKSFGSGSYDIFLLKYESSGILMWNRTWGGIYGEVSQFPCGIVLDSSENIYISGNSFDITGSKSYYCLLKYNDQGDLLWNRTWGFESEDWCIDIAIDDSDNIYLTGLVTPQDQFPDSIMCIIKYNSSGIEQWNRTWGYSNSQIGKLVAVDSLNNVYVAGRIAGELARTDIFLIRYDMDGRLEWNVTWGDPIQNSWEDIFDIKIDSADNVIISGICDTYYGSGYGALFLLKFNESGNLKWEVFTSYGGNSLASIKIDSYDNIYIIGNFPKNGHDIYLAKISEEGFEIASISWGGDLYDGCSSLILDSKNNIYITGYTSSYGAGDNDIFLIKFSDLNISKILIDNNGITPGFMTWSQAVSENLCSGSGTLEDPFIIENFTMDGGIIIKNSNISSVIRNCTVSNLYTWPYQGIRLENVSNSLVYNNTYFNSESNGIYLKNCDKSINITKNIIRDIEGRGLYVESCSDVLISNNSISSDDNGILINFTNNSNIINNTVKSGSAGIYLISANKSLISLNNILNCDSNGILLSGNNHFNEILNNSISGSSEEAIRVESYCTNNNISNNLIDNNFGGLILDDSCSLNKIFNNTLKNNINFGISIADYCDDNMIVENTINNTLKFIGNPNPLAGILIDDSVRIEILNNIINNSEGFGIHLTCNNILYSYHNNISGNKINNNYNSGIHLEKCLYSHVSNNDLNKNQLNGITIRDCSNSNLTHNIIMNNNQIGIFIDNSSGIAQNNYAYNNSFINNVVHACDNGTNNYWDNGYLGNYWDDYLGKDEDDDNIGDTPYNISGTARSRDNFPIYNDGDDPPQIIIISPNVNDIYGENAPSFNLQIKSDIPVNTTWYTLYNGSDWSINYTLSKGQTSGYIDQELWDDCPNGTVIMRFYANDSLSYLGFSEIVIRKDISPPIIIINEPLEDQIFKMIPVPNYNFTIYETNIMAYWYRLKQGEIITENITFFTSSDGIKTGSIDEGAWNLMENGSLILEFYANDTEG
ncbi:MAG: hypothetical protein EU548_06855, partial [Promethearchaeota archaeon]